MATMNVSLPEPMKTSLEARLKDGHFSNTSDDVRHLIRRDQGRVQAIDNGARSGEPAPFAFKAFKARMRAQHARA